MERPSLGNYPKDANPPGGPLKFFAAFDGTTTNAMLNAVDSIRANFPSSNPMTAIDGISGKAIQGDGTAYITYASPNDFGSTASSFTISLWEKRNGIPGGNASFLFTIPSANNQWGSYGFSMFLLFDWGTWTPTTSAKIKFYMVDDNCHCDNWFAWDGGGATSLVPNVQDNNWHHIALTYDGTTSTLTLYVDGVANSVALSWGTHGGLNINASQIQQLNIGGNKNIPDMGWGMNWDGGIDQFRMYATALSASQIQTLYNDKK
ncbi:MAG: LamG domain-containing protein [Bacteroidetes bacterium]|nr:LamG domain-containing protein [Bacteroidota bacterium]MBS1539155.1 LamG domain-containing protein [Bacteroidota bacterium]